MVWATDPSNLYRKCYKHADSITQKRIKLAILELINSNDPRRNNDLKSGQIAGEYGYRITDACRLIYVPDFQTHTIWLDRVCSHNMSYSKRG